MPQAQQAALEAAAAEQARAQAELEEQLGRLNARKHDLVLQLKQVAAPAASPVLGGKGGDGKRREGKDGKQGTEWRSYKSCKS